MHASKEELSKVADIICSFFKPEELESLSMESRKKKDREDRHFTFKDQIIIAYSGRCLKVEMPEEAKGKIEEVMSMIRPISDLKRDGERYEVNRKLLEIFAGILFK